VPQQRDATAARFSRRPVLSPLARFLSGGSWDRFDELARASNKFLRCARYQGDILKTSTPGPPAGFSLSCLLALRSPGRVLTASGYTATTTAEAELLSAIAY
jgi:hypothetical protein